jgi:hypothetical protein
MNNKEYEKVVNQYIEILMYDIHIKSYELKKNNIKPEKADIIFKHYYNEKIREFKQNTLNAKKIFK